MTRKIITKDSLKAMVEVADREYVVKVVGRALVAIYQRQTPSEKTAENTYEANSVGFSGTDGFIGSKFTEFFIKNGYLTDKQLQVWLKPSKSGYPKICKYWKQLNEIAVAKANAKIHNSISKHNENAGV